MDDVATALTESIASDGQTNPSANLPMNNKKHTGVAAGTSRTDYADVGSVQDGGYLWGGTGGGTVDVITLTLSPSISSLVTGMKIRFLALGANTTAVTVNPNGIGGTALKKAGGTALAAGDIPGAGAVVEVVYDGTDLEYTNFDSNVDLTSPGEIGGTTPAAATFTTVDGILGSVTPAAVTGTTLKADTSLELASGTTANEISIDGTLAGDSDDAIPTEKAAKTYVDSLWGRGTLVTHSVTQSINNLSNTVLDFDTESYDTDTIHDTVTNNSRLTVPTGITKVRVVGQVAFVADTTGFRGAAIIKNGAALATGPQSQIPAPAVGDAILNISSAVLEVVATDYFEVQVIQNRGSALNVQSVNTWFSMELIK